MPYTNKTDLISIIIPVYNAEKYLDKCINSVINQTYKNLEIILIDDGSPDNSGKICDEYAQKDERIVVIHKQNGGQADARNCGLEKATGKYIGFVDSDDYIKEDMYETLYNDIVCNNADVSIISLAMVRVNGDIINGTDTKEKYCYENEEIIKQLLLHSTLKNYSCDKLYKKELFDNIRYETGVIYEDINMSLKVMQKAKKVIYNDIIKYYYVKHKEASSAICSEKNVNNYLDAIITRYNFIQNNYPNLELYNLYAIANACIHSYYKVMLSNLNTEIYREKLNFFIEKCKYINSNKDEVINLFSIYQKACFYMLLNDEELYINFLRDRQRKNKSNSAKE